MELVNLELCNVPAHVDDEENCNWIRTFYVEIGFCVVHLFIFVFGLVGNTLVIHSVLKDKSKRTVVNLFMSNLAVANIVLNLFIVGLAPAFLFKHGWTFGSIICHLWPRIYCTVSYISSLTLISIAVDRYFVIVKPSKEKLTMLKLIITIAIIWFVSIAATMPFGLFVILVEIKDYKFKWTNFCVSQWPSATSEYVYVITIFVMLLLIPLIVIAYFYAAIFNKFSNMSTDDNCTQMAEKRRTNRLLLLMVIVLYFCWIPIHVYDAATVIYWEIQQWKHLEVLFRVFHVMAMSSTGFIPLFYMRLNKI